MSAYYFPGKNGWSFSDPNAPVHSSGARVFYEQLDGADEYDWRIQWWSVTAAGEKRGPFARFHLALRAAVPRGQLWLPGVAA